MPNTTVARLNLPESRASRAVAKDMSGLLSSDQRCAVPYLRVHVRLLRPLFRSRITRLIWHGTLARHNQSRHKLFRHCNSVDRMIRHLDFSTEVEVYYDGLAFCGADCQHFDSPR